jgi:hypothetical protein
MTTNEMSAPTLEPIVSIDVNGIPTPNVPCAIVMNTTITTTLGNTSFDILPKETVNILFRDGRVISHFLEHWVSIRYGLVHVGGCADHDMKNDSNHDTNKDDSNHDKKYDEKTFTKAKGGCKFMPSSMIGKGRKFDQKIFLEKSEKLIYVIVSVINFPEIKIRFVKGSDLARQYPKGIIPLKDHDKFFTDS